jgi:hypothetical protein
MGKSSVLMWWTDLGEKTIHRIVACWSRVARWDQGAWSCVYWVLAVHLSWGWATGSKEIMACIYSSKILMWSAVQWSSYVCVGSYPCCKAINRSIKKKLIGSWEANLTLALLLCIQLFLWCSQFNKDMISFMQEECLLLILLRISMQYRELIGEAKHT